MEKHESDGYDSQGGINNNARLPTKANATARSDSTAKADSIVTGGLDTRRIQRFYSDLSAKAD